MLSERQFSSAVPLQRLSNLVHKFALRGPDGVPNISTEAHESILPWSIRAWAAYYCRQALHSGQDRVPGRGT